MSYYGASYWRARWASWQDARTGRLAQANARLGGLKLPGDRGPVLWLQGGSGHDDLRLGVELCRAISDKRRDLRMILTFEREDATLFPESTAGIERLGYGFGPCAHPRALATTLERLRPLRYLGLGRVPSPTLARLLGEKSTPALAIAAPPTGAVGLTPWEAVYPRSQRQYQQWESLARDVGLQEPVDFLTLVTVAQVEPNFRNLILGSQGDALFWVTGLQARDWPTWIAAWQNSPLRRRGLLFLEGVGAAASLPVLSTWRREPVEVGSILRVDEARWHPALAAACDAVHLLAVGNMQLWQIFAGGRPLSQGLGLQWALPSTLTVEPRQLAQPAAVLQHWASVLAEPIAAREEADAYRRYFWQERRVAGERLPEFLQRVFDW
ncbi:hypothetical protein HFU84_09035 [Acidithiobacillus sp. CV18-2]|uniref:3-deoxy-D-manno-octulosonic-acid transferase N-terminal domain-containing protein n=1 Tax=Igneacidithiobacillus copahuensis TaxID=2724909 RepID=A0AAE2YQ48_9PROT|nr:hypothetical protein [Igneacidithiobacillus copahuensis]MBU2755074.1 hypothetical protein [Acidithiobacillus sp. CV18-3]MBU2756635.1 hypothetical protein [Acidithiobacillus sp. BN09-2]MBU2777646.1 hypothetical protein [Acidithiobacillus sp. CV18-2]MBU2796573.1 hypothetical protein [Acidithiobacillus sp. VAN18-2]MBU2800641.1 hypothetical protein [Acidithiobacillus sp. VAN18-4]UTV81252.1 hypothetical protein MQE22_01155 [Acidithiobacillus sp. YTS05]